MEKLEEIHKEILNGNMDILKDFPLLYCLSENKENFVVLRKGRIVKEENRIKYFSQTQKVMKAMAYIV